MRRYNSLFGIGTWWNPRIGHPIANRNLGHTLTYRFDRSGTF